MPHAGDQERSTGGQSLASGGLGLWDGERWSLVGGAVVQGTVTCVAVAGQGEHGGDSTAHHLVYVAGRFGMVGDVQASNIAVYNHTSRRWKALGPGLKARDIFALAVWPGVGNSRHSLFAVGSISHAGDLLLGNLGRWRAETETWHPMRNVNGIIRAAAVMHSRLYIGGDFTVAGGQPAAAIAYTNLTEHEVDRGAAVKWREVGAGVQGNVHALRPVAGCLYVGGRIDSVGDHEGIKPANNVARWCVLKENIAYPGRKSLRQEVWEPVDGLDHSGGTVLAIAGADPLMGTDLLWSEVGGFGSRVV